MKLSYDNKVLSYDKDNKEGEKFFNFLKNSFHISKDDLANIICVMFDLDNASGPIDFDVYKNKEYETWYVKYQSVNRILAFDSFSRKEHYATIQLFSVTTIDGKMKKELRKSYFWNYSQHND